MTENNDKNRSTVFRISPKKLIYTLGGTISLLLLIHLLTLISRHVFGHGHLLGIVPLIDMWSEGNISNYYSSISLLTCSLLLYIIAEGNRRIYDGDKYYHWIGLAIIFLFVSIDEMISIHEKIMNPVRELLAAGGIFYFAWIIPYGIIFLFFVLFYLSFFFNLPKKFKLLFAISAAIYLSGSLGFEMIGGVIYESNPNHTLAIDITNTIEETLEMIGVLIFIYGLTQYIAVYQNKISIEFAMNK
jgi:hypothetical protein